MSTRQLALIAPAKFLWSDNKALREFFHESKEMANYRNNFRGTSVGPLITAALTPSFHDIEFIDENFDEIDFDKGYDLVGITGMTQQAKRAYEIADEFRKRGVVVVMGGIHATCLPDEAKEHADSVVVGEVENQWPVLLKDFEKKTLRPFYRSREFVDLKDSPIPRYDLLKEKDVNVVWVQTTRGCPHACEFCVASNVYGKKYRCKSVEQVLKEIAYIKKHLGRVPIAFSDDNMFVNKDFARTLIMNFMNKNVRYMVQTDISVGEDDRLLDLLRQTGCMYLFIGFESLNIENLRNVNRNQWKFKQVEKYPAVIEKIQSYGIGVMGAFIVGMDHDTLQSIRELSQFVVDSKMYGAQITILTPLPGSLLREKLEKENRILHSNWEKYTFLDVVYQPRKMTVAELQDALFEAYKTCYSKEAHARKVKFFKEQLYRNR